MIIIRFYVFKQNMLYYLSIYNLYTILQVVSYNETPVYFS